MAGWVKIYRQIQDNAIWTSNEPFDSRSAWIDLILMANHEEKEVYQNGKFFTVKRGQLHRSQLKLSERWHWNKKRVNLFLKELKKVGMIDYETAKGGATNGTTISIVNYDIFQLGGSTEGATLDPTVDPLTEQRKDNGRPINKNIKNEEKNVKNEKNEKKDSVPAWKNRFDDFWNLYPKKQGKGAAEKSWEKIKPNEDLFNGIMDALRKNIQNNPNWKTENGRFIPNPATWLNQKRWEDSTEWKAAPNKGYEQREYSEDDYKELERRLLGIK